MKTLILTLVLTFTSLNSFANESVSIVETNETVKFWLMDTQL